MTTLVNAPGPRKPARPKVLHPKQGAPTGRAPRTALARDAMRELSKVGRGGVVGWVLKHEIRALVTMLAGARVRLVFQGDGAVTNGQVIALPEIEHSQIYPERLARVLRGYNNHECAHVRYTKFPLILPYLDRVVAEVPVEPRHVDGLRGLAKTVWNIIEDSMIERLLTEEFAGTRENIDTLRAHSTQEAIEAIGLPKNFRCDATNALLRVCSRTNGWSSTAAGEALVDDIRGRNPDALAIAERWEGAIAKLRTTEDAMAVSLEVTREIVEARRPKAAPQPQQRPPEPPEQAPGEEDDAASPDEAPAPGGNQGPDPAEGPGEAADGSGEPAPGTAPGPTGEPPADGDGERGEEEDAPEKSDPDDGESGEGEAGPDDEAGADAAGPEGEAPAEGGDEADGEADGGERPGDDVDGSPEGDPLGPNPGSSGESTSGEPGPEEARGEGPGEGEGAGAGDEAGGASGGGAPSGQAGGGPEDGDGLGADAEDGLEDVEGDEDLGEDQGGAGAGSGEARSGGVPTGGAVDDGVDEDGEPATVGRGGAGGSGRTGRRTTPASPGGAEPVGDGDVADGGGDHVDRDAGDLPDMRGLERGEAAMDDLLGDSSGDEHGRIDIRDVAREIAALTNRLREQMRTAGLKVRSGEGIKGVTRVRRTGTLGGPCVPPDPRIARAVRSIAMANPKVRVTRRLEDGDFDAKNVLSQALGLPDVYKQTRRTPAVQTDLLALVDQSGSTEDILEVMMSMVNALAQASFSVPSLKTSIMTYTTADELDPDDGVLLMQTVKAFEDNPARARAAMGAWMADPGPLNLTPTAEAMLEAGAVLSRRNAQRKVLLLATDGQPNDPEAAIAAHLALKRLGIVTVAVEIGGHHLARMPFDAAVVVEGMAQLPDALTALGREIITGRG